MQPHHLSTRKTTLHIRNMVSNSCLRLVRQELEGTGFIKVHEVILGQATVSYDPQVLSMEGISQVLQRAGFSLIRDKDERLLERIKTSVIELVFFSDQPNTLLRNSDYLSQKVGHSYSQLSKLFSEQTGMTLERYIILMKIEKIKELISYDELSLSEIADRMGYSSVQYLSNQFRQVTGQTVSEYKQQMHGGRKPLSELL